MAFTNKDVMDLRAQMGVGMMDCKKALQETDGNMEKAIEYLREKGISKAAKKATRIAAEGLVYSKVYDKNNVGVVVEVNCETDFVARGAQFQQLVTDIADHIAANQVSTVEELLLQKYKKTAKTIGQIVIEAIAQIGENISVRRFERKENSVFDSYIHGDGRIGVLVYASGKNAKAAQAVLHDVSLQVASMNPQFINIGDVDAVRLAKEKDIFIAQVKEDPKYSDRPAQILEKVVDGKMRKFFEEVCLMDQKFFKDADQSVAQMLQKLAPGVVIQGFVRYERGEGIEKRQDNFAQEINEQVQKMKK